MLLSTLFELCSYTQGKCGIVKELEINQSSHWQMAWSKRFLPKSLPIWFMIGKQHYTFLGTPFKYGTNLHMTEHVYSFNFAVHL